jgi:hypothetical protein
MVAKLNETLFKPEYNIMETSPKLIGTWVLSQPVSANAFTDPVEAVYTVFYVTEKYIIVAMDNGEIAVYKHRWHRQQAII